MIGRVWHRNAHPWWRRLRKRLRLTFSAAVAKSHQVRFVTVNGVQCKQVIFPDSFEARRCEANLEALAATGTLPPLLLRHENQVWVEFVDGRPVDPHADRAQLIDFFAALYRTAPVSQTETARVWIDRLQRDLDFLARIDVIARDEALRLGDAAGAQAPAQVWTGFDFVDPVLKNLLLSDGRVVAIDVEGVAADVLLGLGVAKARLRWLGDDCDAFLAGLHQRGAPDLTPQFPLTELCFLADWTKHKVLQGKSGYVQPELFADWLRRTET